MDLLFIIFVCISCHIRGLKRYHPLPPEHRARVCRNCYYKLCQIRRIKRSLTANSITLLVLASVHSRLDYCNSVLYSLPWSRLQLLQSVLNSAARLIQGLKRFDHISPVLIDLHWLPYPQCVKYKVFMLMLKCLKGLAPAYLVAFCTKVSAVSGRSALRSALCGDLVSQLQQFPGSGISRNDPGSGKWFPGSNSQSKKFYVEKWTKIYSSLR